MGEPGDGETTRQQIKTNLASRKVPVLASCSDSDPLGVGEEKEERCYLEKCGFINTVRGKKLP